jgi:hypothetical protein
MKTCSKCGIEKPLTDYHSAGVIGGKKYIRGECKVCQKKVVKKRDKLVREQYVSWKKTLQCNRCGFNDYRALQFHHERDKEHNIAEMLREKIKIEAEKCEVLCANCHQIHHSRL